MSSYRAGYVCCGLLLSLLSGSFGAYAQVILDGTMGPRGVVQGPNYQIPAQYGQQRGGNLFHSFGVFNVNTNESATFSGPNSVQNIISRVTWGYPSSIDGTLRSTIPGANLFLLNPAGVLFGPNAKLDVSGSFHVSTADYLRLGENDRFYADPTNPSVLSTAPVTAFGFLSSNPAPISVLGSNLTVPAGKTLSVVGGDVLLEGDGLGNGSLSASGGRINIAAVASPGEVRPTTAGLEMSGFSRLGAIDVTAASVSTTGEGGGSIFIRGGQFTVDWGGTVDARTQGFDDGGTVDVHAQEATIKNDSAITSFSGWGKGADITLAVNRLTLENGGYIEVSSYGPGRGGNLTITANEAVNIKGRGTDASGLYGWAYTTGDAGKLQVTTPELTLSQGGLIQSLNATGRGADVNLRVDRLTLADGGNIEVASAGSGRGGDLTVVADEAVQIGTASGIYARAKNIGDAGAVNISAPVLTLADGGIIESKSATGKGADVTLTVDRLTLSSGGYIEVSSRGSGSGGNLNIDANKSVDINGKGAYASGLYGYVYSSGNAGKLSVSTPELTVSDNGVIESLSGTGRGADVTLLVDRLTLSKGSAIRSITVGEAGGGNIVIRGERFTVDGGTVNASTTSSGNGGGIDVRARDVVLTNDGEIRADNFGTGSGSQIRVDAETITLSNGGFMAARARGNGSGGDITLSATKSVSIIGKSSFQSEVTTGSLATGNGGTLRISTPDLTLANNGQLTSISQSQGRGADVVLNVDRLTLSSDGIIDLTAKGTGRGGNLAITANSLTLNSGGNIDVSTTGTGRGGDLTITANDTRISGSGQYFSGLYMVAYGKGDAGKLILSTKGVLTIDDRGVITGASGTNATGRGADISLDVDRLELTRGGFIDVNTLGAGQGGNLTVTAHSSLAIAGNAGVNHISGLYVQSRGSGNAGAITVTTPNLMLSDGGIINGDTSASGKGADISIAVDRLTLTGGLDPTLGGTAISSHTLGSGRGGDIVIRASQSVTLDGQSGPLGSHITTGSGTTGSTAGRSGNIRLSTPLLQLTRHAAIDANTVDGTAGAIDLTVDRLDISGGLIDASSIRGNGQAGRIGVTATDSVTVAGIPAGPTEFDRFGQISSAGSGAGSTGEIAITAPTLVVTAGGRIGTPAVGDTTPAGTSGAIRLWGDRIQILNGGYVTTVSSGPAKAGDINVTAKLLEVSNGGHIEASTTGPGDGGRIVLQVDRLVLSDGGQIRSETTGSGQGGEIQVTAAEAVTIAGAGANTQLTGLFTNSLTPATGKAGAIRITAPVVEINEKGGAILSATTGAGDGGTIELNVDRLVLTPGAYVAVNTVEGSGRGGDVRINARNSVSISGVVSAGSIRSTGDGGTIQIAAPLVDIREGGIIQNTTSGAGDAGSIELQVDRLVLTGGAMVATDTSGGSGRGGAIHINARESISVVGRDLITGSPSRLSASSGPSAAGKAGAITITAPLLKVDSGGAIASATLGVGDAGTVSLQVDRLLLSNGSYISTDTFGVGRGGDITVKAKTVSVSDVGSSLSAATSGAGNAGTITLAVDRLELSEGGYISTDTFGSGRGGDIKVTASESVTASSQGGPAAASGLFASAGAPATGKGGNIVVTAPLIGLERGGFIESATYGAGDAGVIGLNVDRLIVNKGGVSTSTEGTGHGGNITVTAKESISLAGRSDYPDVPFGLQASSNKPTSGDAGNIVVTAPVITVSQGSEISSATQGTGNAGTVTLQGDRLTLSEGGQISTATAGSGRGGDIQVTARDAITIAGQREGRSAALVASTAAVGEAGTITVNAPQLTLGAGGQIESATTGSGNAGTVSVQTDQLIINAGGGISASTGTSGTAQSSSGGHGGTISIITPNVVLNGGRIASDTFGEGEAGNIELKLDRLTLTDGGIISSSTTGGSGRGGTITVDASQSLSITGRNGQTVSGLQATSGAVATGKGGSIDVKAPVVEIVGGEIASSTYGAGDAGTVTLQIDRLMVDGGRIASSTAGTGRGGDMAVTAGEQVILTGGTPATNTSGLMASSNAPTSGNAGNIVVTAPAITVTQGSEISSATRGTGKAGTVTLQVDRLTLSEGGQISTATAGNGRGGDIQVTARDAVSIADQSGERFAGVVASAAAAGDAGVIAINVPQLTLGAGGRVESATTGAGNAGAVSLQVDRLVLQQGGEISTSTGSQAATAQGNRTLLATSQAVPGRGGAITIAAREVVLDDGRITSDTSGGGDAGSIGLRADRLTLANGGSISTNTTAGQGSGGNIDINTADSITITGKNESQPSGIYARSRAPATGNAGNITLSTNRLTLNEGTTITAESELTSGGNILINARDTRLYKNSTITSSVQGNEQSDGGNVTLNGDKLIVYEGGKITARANQGRGGRITINENVFLYEAPRAIPDVLDASSQVAGNQGVVTINARDLNINRTLVALPATYLDASKLLSNRCVAPQAGSRSSFVVRGRGAAPPGPEGPAPASARECLPAIPVTTGPPPLERAATSNKWFNSQ